MSTLTKHQRELLTIILERQIAKLEDAIEGEPDAPEADGARKMIPELLQIIKIIDY